MPESVIARSLDRQSCKRALHITKEHKRQQGGLDKEAAPWYYGYGSHVAKNLAVEVRHEKAPRNLDGVAS